MNVIKIFKIEFYSFANRIQTFNFHITMRFEYMDKKSYLINIIKY